MHLVAAQGLTMAQLIYYQVSLAQGSKPVKSSAHLKMRLVAGWIAECHETFQPQALRQLCLHFLKHHELTVA